jgi:Rrf2 family nitric oxide-sensitive transcriptional repressor
MNGKVNFRFLGVNTVAKMNLTSQADFSIRMLIYLAVHTDGPPVSVDAVAKAYGISTNHLANVAQHLVRLGLVTSVRGRSGGLTLSDEAWKVPLGVLLKEIEPRWDLVECFGPDSRCTVEPACGFKFVLQEAQQAFFAVLNRYTLKDVVTDPRRLAMLLPSLKKVGKLRPA